MAPSTARFKGAKEEVQQILVVNMDKADTRRQAAKPSGKSNSTWTTTACSRKVLCWKPEAYNLPAFDLVRGRRLQGHYGWCCHRRGRHHPGRRCRG
ncbi:hypothetical protein NL676_008949 [Syzygium grande]|nr:hypothetical protein NL676_008949 [Syzygium grande]